ncbi:MAG: AMP-binding protein, partial [Planctomycetota bacterium]
MTSNPQASQPDSRTAFDRTREAQLRQLNRLLQRVMAPEDGCPLYLEKYNNEKIPLTDLAELAGLPILHKSELLPTEADRESGFIPGAARFHYGNPDRYVRYHQTSGTTGTPLVVLDSAEDWAWWMQAWQCVLDSANITAADRVLMAFSFGPFIGFWSANDALVYRGALVIPTGGMSSLQRLQIALDRHATVLCCTPTYAMHLADTAQQRQMDLRACGIDRIIVAGEPGGSIPSVRERIETAWGARGVDHSGASEIGPWG